MLLEAQREWWRGAREKQRPVSGQYWRLAFAAGTMILKMTELAVVYLLRWFDPSSEWLVGEEILQEQGAGELRALFELAADDPVLNVYPVGDREAAALQRNLAHLIDRDAYLYFVEAQQLIG